MLSRRMLPGSPALAVALHRPALADFPDRPIRVVVPFAAGGNTDILARIIAAAFPQAATEVGVEGLIATAASNTAWSCRRL